MENVLLIVELILALLIIVVVLLQRSEGGALGMGGGGGGGLVTARGAGSALTKVTWGLAAAFFAVSLALTVLAAERSASRSVIDGTAIEQGAGDDALLPGVDLDGLGDLDPAGEPGASPLFPPAAE